MFDPKKFFEDLKFDSFLARLWLGLVNVPWKMIGKTIVWIFITLPALYAAYELTLNHENSIQAAPFVPIIFILGVFELGFGCFVSCLKIYEISSKKAKELTRWAKQEVDSHS